MMANAPTKNTASKKTMMGYLYFFITTIAFPDVYFVHIVYH
jgi:hypothetical protein